MRRAALLMLLVGCGGGSGGGGGTNGPALPPPGPLAITSVSWNPSGAMLGMVQAVADQGDEAIVFTDQGVTILQRGAIVASDSSVTSWRAAAAIPAPDGSGTWVAGVGADGQLYHVKSLALTEDISDRYGLKTSKVVDLAAAGSGVGFLLDSGLAIANGANVETYDAMSASIAGGGGKVGAVTMRGVRVVDLASMKETDYALDGALFVALDDKGTLVAATAHALYRSNDHGALDEVFDAGARAIHALASSGGYVWAGVDTELVLFDHGTLTITSTKPILPDARLFGSSSGDVWAVSAGALSRLGTRAGSGDQALWSTTVQPVFVSVCSNCHSQAGSGKDTSGVDLSTYEAWSARRAKVYERVVTDATKETAMPPPSSGFSITDAQRSAIAAWASAP